MSSTVTVGGMEVTSNSDSAASMVESLKPVKDNGNAPRIVQDAGKPTETDGEDVSDAAKTLGKKGGEAAAAKRAAEAKEQDKAAKAKPATAAKDEDDDAEAIAEAEKLEKEGKLGKPRDDPRARMLVKAREAKALKAEVERERAERVRLAAELEQARAPKPAEQPAKTAPAKEAKADEEPKEEDFESYREFSKALARYEARQIIAEERKTSDEQTARAVRDRSVNQAFNEFFGRIGEAAKEDPTIHERTATFVGSLQPSPLLSEGRQVTAFNDLSDEILTSKHAPALAVYFSEHPEDVKRISSLPSRRDVLREVARIEGRLSAAPTATVPRAEVSQASPPVRPVAGSPSAVQPDIYGDLPFEVFKERRERAGR